MHGSRAAVWGLAVAILGAAAGVVRADDPVTWRVMLRPPGVSHVERRLLSHTATEAEHWLLLEFKGARLQAENWLHDTGFSLLEGRDAFGKDTYTIISGPITERWSTLRFRARFGEPHLPGGLYPSRAPAVGFSFAWRGCVIEVEGLDDEDRGYALMGVLRWQGRDPRVHYGLAVPVAVEDFAAVGVLFQVRIHLDR